MQRPCYRRSSVVQRQVPVRYEQSQWAKTEWIFCSGPTKKITSSRPCVRYPTTPSSKDSQLLYFKGRIFVPNCRMRNDLLHDNHTVPVSGHLGAGKTYLRLQPYYYWKRFRDTIDRYVAGCKTCKATKARNHKPFGLLQPLDRPQIKWTYITMVFIAPLPQTSRNNAGLLKVFNRLSKMMRLMPPPPNADAPCVARMSRNHVYRNHGLLQAIISDRVWPRTGEAHARAGCGDGEIGGTAQCG